MRHRLSINIASRGIGATFLRLLLIGVPIVLLLGVWSGRPNSSAQGPVRQANAPATDEFVGSARCAECHASQHSEWLVSQHAAAMTMASEETVLGQFDGRSINYGGVTSVFFRKDSKYFVRTDGPDGELADFEIRYTFGVSPLQQYLIALPKGRLQALGMAWDARPKEVGGQRWFHLYPNRSLKAGDPLHWTGIDQNWNYQCAFCHSTDVKKGYDSATDSFATTWSEISVGCEACHGPASRHIAWATKTGDWQQMDGPGKGFAARLDERNGIAWEMTPSGTAARSKARTTNSEIETCATCHSRRQQISDDFARAHHFYDAFRPSALEQGSYYVDGAAARRGVYLSARSCRAACMLLG